MTTRDSDPIVTEEQAWAKWQEVGELIEILARRSDTPGAWEHALGSPLAGDDRASDPYQVSHAFAQCLTAGIDHVHAVKSLVVDHRELHMSAPASLARGFIENIATAFWLIHPRSRTERVARSMKWHIRNIHDQAEATRGLANMPPPRRSSAERTQQMIDIGVRAGVEDPDYLRRGYRPSQPVEYAEQEAGLGLGVLFSWRLCSGFAHGRPWAYLGMLEQETMQTSRPGIVDVRLTNDFARSLYPVLVGMHLVEVTLKLHEQRKQPLHT